MDVAGQPGAAAGSQLDCRANLGVVLGTADGALWTGGNGYALCTQAGLARIDALLQRSSPEKVDGLRSRCASGCNGTPKSPTPMILRSSSRRLIVPRCRWRTCRFRQPNWQRFASQVLQASYEATLLAAAWNAGRGGSNKVLLTRVGGGVFGNDLRWINDAITRAAGLVRDHGLDLRIVSHGPVPPDLQELVDGSTPERGERPPRGARMRLFPTIGLFRPSRSSSQRQPELGMIDWKSTLREGILSGTLAGVLSAAVLLAAGKRETGSAVAPVNAESHWLWGDQALREDRLTLRHTLTGIVTHQLSTVFWATLYRALRGRRAVRSVPEALLGGIATSMAAAAIDYSLVPKRLSPGFEHRLSRGSMVGVFAAIAGGISVGAWLLRDRD